MAAKILSRIPSRCHGLGCNCTGVNSKQRQSMDNWTNGSVGALTYDVTTAAICRPTNSITLNQRFVAAPYAASISLGGQLGQTPVPSPPTLFPHTWKALGNCIHPGYRVIVPIITATRARVINATGYPTRAPAPYERERILL